jgi:tetratricopeptide (TPR) repeat protein
MNGKRLRHDSRQVLYNPMKAIQLPTLIVVLLLPVCNLTNAQSEEKDKAKAVIAEMLKSKFEVYENREPGKENGTYSSLGQPLNVMVFDDRIEIFFKKDSKTVFFKEKLTRSPRTVLLGNFLFMQPNKKRDGTAEYDATDKANMENGFNEQLFGSLSYLCNLKYISSLELFKPLAEQYRSLPVKPPVPEEQRRYIVQANALNQMKQYDQALELYHKAVEVDPVAFPAAYSNMALLSAQMNNYTLAIHYMKRYLMLVPEAEDARSAQDKIYEWEVMTAR